MQDVSTFDGLTSEELATQARAGSEDSFTELVRRHSTPLFGFLSRKVASRQDAEDLTQETFARAHQRLHQYDSAYKFKSWLFTIAARLSYSHYRKRRDVAVPEIVEITTETPASVLSESEGKENLWIHIQQILPANQLEPLWLRYNDGLTIKEIAQKTGRSQVSVKVLLHRARTRLAKSFMDRRPEL